MIVVDTNILVPLFISGPSYGKALELLHRDPTWSTEPFALVELANVLSTYQRANLLSAQACHRHLEEAEYFLAPFLRSISLKQALEFAMRYRVTLHDAQFLAVAISFDKKLITEDVKLRNAVPELTQSLDEALATPC